MWIPGIQLILTCLFGLVSIVIYQSIFGQNATQSKGVAGDCEIVKSMGDRLKNEFAVAAIFVCDASDIPSVGFGGCPCSGESSTHSCSNITVCILWKETPASDTLIDVVKSISEHARFIISEKYAAKGVITHFFVDSHAEQPVHFANWLQQEDGSWWFDQLPFKTQRATTSGNDFYIGKYEGWMPRFQLRASSGPSGLEAPADWAAFQRHLRHSRFVPCDWQRAHQFHLAEGRDASADAERFRHRAWRLLAAAAGALDQLGVPFWLSSGTCLGYYRQCDFVPYMGDVDIGVRISSVREWAGDSALPSLAQLVAIFAERRLRLVHRFGLPEDSLELSFRSPDDIKLDIFFFYQDGNVMWNGGTQARSGRKFRYDFAAFELCWTEFRELRVRIPCDTERYLVSNYGPGWRQPQPVWDWKSSPPNVRENGVWTADQLPEAVQLLET